MQNSKTIEKNVKSFYHKSYGPKKCENNFCDSLANNYVRIIFFELFQCN
jgi:hypothetical protein